MTIKISAQQGLKETRIPDYVIRLYVLIACLFCGMSVIIVQVVDVVFFSQYASNTRSTDSSPLFSTMRGNITDRNGILLAANLTTASLYANPHMVIDAEETATQLNKVFPEISKDTLLASLRSDKKFLWIKRNLSPKEQHAVHQLGLPGIGFENDQRRIYPHGALLSHILGYVGVDGIGLAGVERYFNKKLLGDNDGNHPDNLQLSVDLRVQNIVHEELSYVMASFSAIGASAIIADVSNGEVLSMVSLPDFDPHNLKNAKEEQLFNRASMAVQELGSVLKPITFATALEAEAVSLTDQFDVGSPLQVSKYFVHDYHSGERFLTVPEILMHSSNIGTAKIGLVVGPTLQHKFLRSFGILDPLKIELYEKGTPSYPTEDKWNDVNTVTISYGHGIAFTPLHMVQAMAALVNGGIFHSLTLLKTKKDVKGERIIREKTSNTMRKLLRLVVEHGTGKMAAAEGYMVGGKTGTGNKAQKGGYSKNAKLSSFLASFPIHEPRYVVLVVLDEPQGTKHTYGFATGGWTAAPVVGSIIRRVAPILGVLPVDEKTVSVENHFINYHPMEHKLESL